MFIADVIEVEKKDFADYHSITSLYCIIKAPSSPLDDHIFTFTIT